MDILKQLKKGFRKIKAPDTSMIKAIESSAKQLKIDAIPILGGSVAKQTNLDVHDVDIFVKFKDDADISKKLEKILKNKFKKVEILHGSRDYFQIMHRSITYEIVPVLDISSAKDAKNITDVSPLHAEWVNKNIKNLRDDVRLAKLFCKANRVYGAESYIRGFSGYILEILIIYHGSFKKLLKASQSWKPKVIIDIKKFHKDPLKKLNKSKTHSPLIIIDPVDENRNAAAAMDIEKFQMFKLAAKKFLKKPSKKFFTPKKFKVRKGAIVVEIIPEDGKKDIIGARLLRCYEHIKKQLMLNDFEVKDSDWNWDKKAVLWFVCDKLSDKVKRIGPKTYSGKENITRFNEKYKNVFIEGNTYYAFDKRKYTEPKKFIAELVKQEWFKPKIKKIKIL